jgi:hypothetical protein
MPYILASIFLALFAVVLVPNWLLLVWGVPLVGLHHTPIVSIGGAHIRLYDLLILVVVLKIFCFLAISRRLVFTHLYKPIGAFLAILLGATLISNYRFGSDVFISELIAFLRFLGLFVVFFLTLHSILTTRQLELSDKCLSLFGFGVTVSIYLGLIIYPFGIELGEVRSEGQISRAFGILGDQAGFLLPFFLYRELINGRIVFASFVGIAILLTGTRGVLATLGVGLLTIFLLSRHRKYLWAHRHMTLLLICITIIGGILSFDPGGMWMRLQDPERLHQGIVTRENTVMLAARVFLDNILTGVGFTGFRFAALDYSSRAILSEQLDYSPALMATAANQYLQVATDAGILGLIVFIWMMRRCLQILKAAQAAASDEVRRSFEAAYIWLWSLLIGTQSAAWLLPDMTLSYIFWIILGMAVAAVTIKQERVSVATAVRNRVYSD